MQQDIICTHTHKYVHRNKIGELTLLNMARKIKQEIRVKSKQKQVTTTDRLHNEQTEIATICAIFQSSTKRTTRK